MPSIEDISFAYPVWITLFLSSIVIGLGFCRGRFLDVAPTLTWALLMQFPFILQSGLYFSSAALNQGLGIGIIGLAVAFGDFLSIRYRSQFQRYECLPKTMVLLITSLFCVIYFPLYHLVHVNIDNIPLFSWLWGDVSAVEVAERRELFGKNLDVNPIYKYAFQWVCTIFGPLAFSILFCQRKYFLAALIFIWVSIYVLLSTAKLPIFLFALFSVLGILIKFPSSLRRLLCVIACSILLGLVILGVMRIGEISRWLVTNGNSNISLVEYRKSEVAADTLRQLTLNDIERIDGVLIPGVFGKKFNGLVYRTFLSPVDVSYQWYLYFEFKEQKRSLNELLGILGDQKLKASNRVGRWAYHERFPNHYLASINAYSSIDADAYSFAGILGVCVVGFVYLLVRIFTVWLSYKPIGILITPIMTGFFAVFLIQASFQAILFSQGLFILIIVGLMYCKTRESYKAGI